MRINKFTFLGILLLVAGVGLAVASPEVDEKPPPEAPAPPAPHYTPEEIMNMREAESRRTTPIPDEPPPPKEEPLFRSAPESSESSVVMDAGGPDSYGYRWMDSKWTTADANIVCSSCGDDGEYNITMPFSFNFYGTSSNQLRVGNNGAILFGTTTGDVSWDNSAMSSAPNNFIAPFWDDLYTHGSIRAETFGSAPNRRFVVEWRDKDHYSGTSYYATFQVIFYESSNIIQFLYYDTYFGSSSYDYGVSATVGIRKDGSNYKQYSYNSAVLTVGLDPLSIWFIPTSTSCEDYYVIDNKWTTADANIVCSSCGDDGEYNITMPFSFNFYGTSSNQLRVGNNGAILFGTTTGDVSWNNSAMSSAPNNFIAPFWDDLYTNGSIRTETFGSAPNRRFVVEWRDKDHYSGTSSYATFQVIFYETSNIIQFLYYDTYFENSSYDDGASATVGIRKDASNYLQYSYNSASLTADRGILFIPPISSGCSPPTSVTATANGSATGTSVCSGDAVTLSGSHSGGGCASGSWQYRWRTSSGTIRDWSTTLDHTVYPTTTTTYYLDVRCSACPGSYTTDDVTVNVGSSASGTPTLSSPVNGSATPNSRPTFSWSCSGCSFGSPNGRYEININGTWYDAGTATSFTPWWDLPPGGNTWYVRIISDCGAGGTSPTWTVYVTPDDYCGNVDHGGNDWIISSDRTISGHHYNVGVFRVDAGVTATVNSSCHYVDVDADKVYVYGTIDASGAGEPGGAGGDSGDDETCVDSWGDNCGDCDYRWTEKGEGGGNGYGTGGGSGGTSGGTGNGCTQDCGWWGDEIGWVKGAGGGGGGGGGGYGGAGGDGGPGEPGENYKDYSSSCFKEGKNWADECCDAGGGARGSGGSGGGTYGTANGTDISWGSGGGGAGGGGNGYFNNATDGEPGGAGGGMVKLHSSGTMVVTGSIYAYGLDGGQGGTGGSAGYYGDCCSDPSEDDDEYTWGGMGGEGGGAGGGSGGGILLDCDATDMDSCYITGFLDAHGGDGGPAINMVPTCHGYDPDGYYAWDGGGGGGGRIKVFYSQCGFITDVSFSYDVSGGIGYEWGGDGTFYQEANGSPPTAPTLSSDPPYAFNNCRQNYPIQLGWSAEGTQYYIEIDDNPDFSSPVITAFPTTNSYTINSGLTDGQTYYWRVKAKQVNCWGNFSEVWSFTLDTGASEQSWYQNCRGIYNQSQFLQGTQSGDITIQSEAGVTDDAMITIQP